jgi:hypothetical protein
MAQFTIFGYTFDHLERATPLGNPVRGYAVKTEEGYWIRVPSFEENVWKTSTALYPTDDLANVQIVHESELPEGAELCGGNTEPEPEVM